MSELLWEAFGILFIFSVGTLLHFTYDALGKWKPVGLIAPVNESVWEHLKMGFWPTLIYGIIEFFYLPYSIHHMALAKASAILMILGCLILFHYGYKFFLKRHVVLLDILFFLLAITLGQGGSWYVLSHAHFSQTLYLMAWWILLITTASFLYFTFHPPKFKLFKDSKGNHGI